MSQEFQPELIIVFGFLTVSLVFMTLLAVEKPLVVYNYVPRTFQQEQDDPLITSDLLKKAFTGNFTSDDFIFRTENNK